MAVAPRLVEGHGVVVLQRDRQLRRAIVVEIGERHVERPVPCSEGAATPVSRRRPSVDDPDLIRLKVRDDDVVGAVPIRVPDDQAAWPPPHGMIGARAEERPPRAGENADGVVEVIGGDEIGDQIAVQVSDGDVHRRDRGQERLRRREETVSVPIEDGDGLPNHVCGGDVEVSIPIEIGQRDRIRAAPRREIGLGFERAVSIASQDGDARRSFVRHDQIDRAVSIHVSRRQVLRREAYLHVRDPHETAMP